MTCRSAIARMRKRRGWKGHLNLDLTEIEKIWARLEIEYEEIVK